MQEPDRPWLRVARAVALISLGVVVVTRQDAALSLVLTVAGVFIVCKGLEALLRLIYRPEEEEETRARLAAGRPRRRRTLRRLLVAGIAAAVVAAFVGIFFSSGGASVAAPRIVACNGHRALCGRPFDRVVLPGTHNSMSAPLPDWFATQQDRPIAGQLQDGIRGLLIDTHYAERLPNGNVRTDLAGERDLQARLNQDGVSQAQVDAAKRLRGRLGFSGSGERGMYLCHSFCELGATPLADVLDDIRRFLVAHPHEVLVIVNQDYVTPADFVEAVDDAGLGDLAYRGPTSGAWPTLRTMIARGQRILFLAENRAGGAPWYHLAYESIVMETPFSFRRPAQLTDPAGLAATCRPNRGPARGAPVFLMNHWITTDPLPLPSNAQQVNAEGPLLARAEECRRVRDHVPTLLAVDFYRRGDLFAVVDRLNGVGRR